jgi:hypothetical protein
MADKALSPVQKKLRVMKAEADLETKRLNLKKQQIALMENEIEHERLQEQVQIAEQTILEKEAELTAAEAMPLVED